MRRRPALPFLVCALFLLAACGGKDGGKTDAPGADEGGAARADGPAGALPEGVPAAVREALAAAAAHEPTAAVRGEEVELTEEMLEDFFEVYGEVMRAAAEGRDSTPIFAHHEWDPGRFQAVTEQFSRGVQSAGGAMVLEELERQIAQQERSLANMPASTREQMQKGIEALKQQRDALLADGMDSEIARKNAALIRKYMARFMAASQGR